jgi:hypothetical protein
MIYTYTCTLADDRCCAYHCCSFAHSAHDIDQEIKECAIAAMGVLLARMGRELGAEVPNVLALLMDRLRNEITRVSAAINITITTATIRFSIIIDITTGVTTSAASTMAAVLVESAPVYKCHFCWCYLLLLMQLQLTTSYGCTFVASAIVGLAVAVSMQCCVSIAHHCAPSSGVGAHWNLYREQFPAFRLGPISDAANAAH